LRPKQLRGLALARSQETMKAQLLLVWNIQAVLALASAHQLRGDTVADAIIPVELVASAAPSLIDRSLRAAVGNHACRTILHLCRKHPLRVAAVC
jgi:hypothetical protein